jgi:hypothetical protein
MDAITLTLGDSMSVVAQASRRSTHSMRLLHSSPSATLLQGLVYPTGAVFRIALSKCRCGTAPRFSLRRPKPGGFPLEKAGVKLDTVVGEMLNLSWKSMVADPMDYEVPAIK